MDRRILELAVEFLQREKERIEAEIESVQAELKGTGTTVRQTTSIPSVGIRRTRTVAERKAQSQRMREIWAARRAKAGKTNAKAPSTSSAKARTITDAQKKTISLKMKEAWKKRKAAAKKAQAK